jgi:hypothetical protein
MVLILNACAKVQSKKLLIKKRKLNKKSERTHKFSINDKVVSILKWDCPVADIVDFEKSRRRFLKLICSKQSLTLVIMVEQLFCHA